MKTELFSNIIDGVTIHQIVETEIGHEVHDILQNPDFLGDLTRVDWLRPHYVDAHGRMKAIVQSFVFLCGRRVVVVDTCFGNDKTRKTLSKWHKMQSDFLETFARTGLRLEDVTDVLCTHMHIDHVGWNTRLSEGKIVPTFPNARYYFARREFDYWKSRPVAAAEHDREAFEDSVEPVVAAGQAIFVDDDADLGDGIRLVPTPGHTPGHVSISLELSSSEIFITGDCIHHPCQISRVEWSSNIDFDPALSRKSREDLLRTAADRGAWLLGTHFCVPSLGRIVPDGDGNFRFSSSDCVTRPR